MDPTKSKMEKSSIELSIVLPTYREKENLKLLIPEIEAEFSGTTFEIIIVDDHSDDGTRELLRELGTIYKNIIFIERAGLMGIGGALREGYDRASGAFILSSDADLSFTASDMQRLYAAISPGADMVLGFKIAKEAEGREKSIITQRMMLPVGRFCNWIVRKVSGIGDLKEYNTNFRIMKSALWKSLATRETGNFFLFETILRASRKGAKISELPVTFLPRKFGESKLNFLGQAPGYFITLLRSTWFDRSEPLR